MHDTQDQCHQYSMEYNTHDQLATITFSQFSKFDPRLILVVTNDLTHFLVFFIVICCDYFTDSLKCGWLICCVMELS